jgi:hypothetical protein
MFDNTVIQHKFSCFLININFFTKKTPFLNDIFE